MIKVCTIKPMSYTPFGGFSDLDIPYLESVGIIMITNPKEADVLVAQNRKHLLPYFYKFRKTKKYLIYTNEPRFDTSFESTRKELLGYLTCHVMNVYTGDVFVSPFCFHAQLITDELELLSNDFCLSNKKIVGLMSYYEGTEAPSLIKDNEDRDLIKKRSEIALQGYKIGVFDIYGKGWEKGISKEDSRSGDWVKRKKELLKEYNFNLCFENTASARYITEKIWDSIDNYCLPIYYGRHTEIYDYFPSNSFIDYSDFKNPKELFSCIEHMTDSEYIQRMNACIEVYQNIASKGESFARQERIKALDAIAQKLNIMMLTKKV